MNSMSFGKDLGLIHEAMVTGRKVGATRAFWTALAHNEEAFKEALTAVEPFIVSDAEKLVRIAIDSESPLMFDKAKNGWRIFSQDSCSGGEFQIGLVSPFDGRDGMILGGELIKRSQDIKASQHQRCAEALYRERGELPPCWRDITIAFTGTVWEDSQKKRYIICLNFVDQWRLTFRCLTGGFGKGVVLPYIHVVPKEPARN